MRQATYAAVGVAAVLISVKAVAWFMTGSVAMLSSLVDSLLDSLASVINMVAVRQSLVPADAEHRFGHGKAEPLSGLAQAAFVGGSGVLIFLEAISRFAEPKHVENPGVGIGVMIFSVVLTLALIRFQAFVIRRSSSVAIKADRLHYAGDLLMNASVIASLGLSAWLGLTWIDPLFGVGIAGVLVKGAFDIGRQALDMLMDRELPAGERERILAIAKSHPEVMSVHDLRTRASGLSVFIQFHMVMPAAMTLSRAHVISDEIERRLLEAFPGAEILIHQDPTDAPEPEIVR